MSNIEHDYILRSAESMKRTGAAPPFALWSEERWESTSPRDRGIETFFALKAVGAYTPKMQPPTMEDARLLLMTGKYDPKTPTVTAFVVSKQRTLTLQITPEKIAAVEARLRAIHGDDE